MRKILFLAVIAVLMVVASSCGTKEKCWKVTGSVGGINGEWYEDGTKAEVEKECREKGIENYTITEASEYMKETCPETMDVLPDLYDYD